MHAAHIHTVGLPVCCSGVEALAEGLQGNSSLRELKLANQRVSFTQQAEERLAAALESNFVVTRLTIDLRSTRAREMINKFLLRNQDELRRERLKSGVSSPPSKSIAGVNVADWSAEAKRVALSALLQYDAFPISDSQSKMETYILTGSVLWGQATEAERRCVVEAFATNTTVQRVEMVNALVTDALGQAWGGVLRQNSSITALNLESNSISSGWVHSNLLAASPHACRTHPHGWPACVLQWGRGFGGGTAGKLELTGAQARQPARELHAAGRGATGGGSRVQFRRHMSDD